MKNLILKLKKVENLLFFLTLLFLPTQLGLHLWPQFSHIYSLKIDYLSPVLYFWDILAAILLVVWILQKPHINKVALNLLLLFLFTQTLSLLGAANIGAGLVRLEQYIVAGLFGVYIASKHFTVPITSRTLDKVGVCSSQLYLPLLLGVLGESVIAVLQFIKGSTLGLWILGERTFSISTPGIAKFDFYDRQFLRPYGTFPHPNVLAGYLLSVLCILYYVLKEKQKLNKLIFLFGSFATFLTMSRTTIFASLAILLVVLRKKWLLLVLFLLVVASPILFTRFASLFNFDSLTVLRREELIDSARQLFMKAPIYGVGLNNFIPAMAGNLISGPSRFLQPVHNIFLLALSETGIVGLAGFILLVGYPVFKISNIKYQISKILIWIIIIFLGMFDHYFLTLPQGYRLLFLVWGLSFYWLRIQGTNNSMVNRLV